MNNTEKNIPTITIGGYTYPNLTLEGKLSVSSNDNIISMKSNDNKYINIIFSKTTPSDYVTEIGEHIASVLADDGRADITISRLKDASEDFLKYIKNEISHARPSNDLYVLDVGTGIFITNRIDIGYDGIDCSK